VIPDDFARVFKEKMNSNRLWPNDLLMFKKLEQGMNPWWETGRGNIHAGCVSMAIAPIGIINAGNLAQAYQDAFCIASINEDGNIRDFAAASAAGVAAAFSPGATFESVIESMFTHSEYLTKRALTLLMEMAHASSDVDDYARKFYPSSLLEWSWPQTHWKPDGHFCVSSIEFLPAVWWRPCTPNIVAR